jgi:hypothetical protein
VALVVQCTFALEGEPACLFISAELADAVHGLLDGFVGDGSHAQHYAGGGGGAGSA